MRYSMSYTDHRERVERMEFEAPSDSVARNVAHHHMAQIKRIFRADHPGARVRRGWYVLWIVINEDTGVYAYNRREKLNCRK
jgi:hypothetical protein